jgi:hypothetical protein
VVLSEVTVIRKEWTGVEDVILVPVGEIVIPGDLKEPDPVLVASIANSIETLGLIHPIAVRICLRVRPETSSGITKFSEHDAD